MSLPISDYAIVGDTHTTALISRCGSVDWLCWPRHDSPALFLRLLDEEKGGACTVHFREGGSGDAMAASRRYLPDTNVLETTFTREGGTATLTDFMPVYPPNTMPEEGPDGDAESRLIRILSCTAGRVEGWFTVRPSFDYARQACIPVREADGSVLFTDTGDNRIRVTASAPAAVDGDAAVIRFSLAAGEQLHLVLTQGEDGRVSAVEGLEDACRRLRETERYWTGWVGRCLYEGPHADAVRRSALVLKLLTYSPTGAIIAAPTAGLPEAVPGNRNFDYRYVWLRDASFTVTAFANLGYRREAEEYLRFLRGVDGSGGRDLKLMYGVDGVVPAEETLPHLAGWRGVGPVMIGNAAAVQTQHDIYGELLLAIEDYLEGVDYRPPEAVRHGLPELVGNLAERAMVAVDEPDQGIWEFRTAPRHYVHSKGLIWVALDRAVKIAEALGGFEAAHVRRWQAAQQRVREEYLRRGWNEVKGAYVQSYDSDELDAAVLRIALFDALPLDERLERTLDAVHRELGDGDLVYRYRNPDGMEGEEGTFTVCAFWYASCLGLLGRIGDARDRFARLLDRANDLGLFAEEIDAATGEQRGNFPQGFTHMAVINHLVRLRHLEQARSGSEAE